MVFKLQLFKVQQPISLTFTIQTSRVLKLYELVVTTAFEVHFLPCLMVKGSQLVACKLAMRFIRAIIF